MIIIIQLKHNRGKVYYKKINNLRDLWDYNKIYNICVIGTFEELGRQIWKNTQITLEKFPNWENITTLEYTGSKHMYRKYLR